MLIVVRCNVVLCLVACTCNGVLFCCLLPIACWLSAATCEVRCGLSCVVCSLLFAVVVCCELFVCWLRFVAVRCVCSLSCQLSVVARCVLFG